MCMACVVCALTEHRGQRDVFGFEGAAEGDHEEVAHYALAERCRQAQVEQLAAVGATGSRLRGRREFLDLGLM